MDHLRKADKEYYLADPDNYTRHMAEYEKSLTSHNTTELREDQHNEFPRTAGSTDNEMNDEDAKRPFWEPNTDINTQQDTPQQDFHTYTNGYVSDPDNLENSMNQLQTQTDTPTPRGDDPVLAETTRETPR